MNYKKFKKIIKNLLKFSLSTTLSLVGWLIDTLVLVEYKLDKLYAKLSKKPSKYPISRDSEAIRNDIDQDYMGDIYIAEHRKERQ